MTDTPIAAQWITYPDLEGVEGTNLIGEVKGRNMFGEFLTIVEWHPMTGRAGLCYGARCWQCWRVLTIRDGWELPFPDARITCPDCQVK